MHLMDIQKSDKINNYAYSNLFMDIKKLIFDIEK